MLAGCGTAWTMYPPLSLSASHGGTSIEVFITMHRIHVLHHLVQCTAVPLPRAPVYRALCTMVQLYLLSGVCIMMDVSVYTHTGGAHYM